jgi:hypothetical protein
VYKQRNSICTMLLLRRMFHGRMCLRQLLHHMLYNPTHKRAPRALHTHNIRLNSFQHAQACIAYTRSYDMAALSCLPPGVLQRHTLLRFSALCAQHPLNRRKQLTRPALENCNCMSQKAQIVLRQAGCNARQAERWICRKHWFESEAQALLSLLRQIMQICLHSNQRTNR